jgi:uncharacterized membrane protein YcaP (DUF421 family)
METVIRVSLIFFFVLGTMRVLGKRDLAQLSPFELVMLMLIPDIAQQGMVREDYSITNALIGLGTLFSLTFINGMVTYLFKPARDVIEGKATVLFSSGKFFQDVMDKERISASEIIGSMHKAGLESLDQVKWIILESEGELSFIPKNPAEHFPQSGLEKDKLAS